MVLLAVGGAFGNYLRYTEEAPDRPAEFQSIPLESQTYYGEERRLAEYNYEVLKADTTTLRRYMGADGDIYWLFVAYFGSQKYGSQIHSPKHCLPGGGWRILTHETYPLALPGGKVHDINRLIIADRDEQELMLYWYQTRGGFIRSEFGLKWDLIVNSLMLHPTDAAFVRITLSLRPDESVEKATQRAETFIREFYPGIQEALPFPS
jgi:EpsI family protein